ncbi:MAG: T9SS type A sorting domain-containing protein [Bacteroidetes bacterium]|nr:T9SS type A sorting domain-containing protein [Bacteroidota bacterium]
MKKQFLLFAVALLLGNCLSAQVVCVLCFNTNDSISQNVTNYIVNGGMENSTCAPWPAGDRYCPNSSAYNCDITNWTCTGGGTGTYACMMDGAYIYVVEGVRAAYFGNSFSQNCNSTVGDTSCLTMNDCEVGGIPAGFPTNDPTYGGTNGVSLEQTVTGLTPGASYVLEFWAGGEWSFTDPGIFGVDVGYGYTMLRNKPSTTFSTDTCNYYIIEFIANSTTHNIKFTNWGHICYSCTELILDNVRLYPASQVNPNVSLCVPPLPVAIFNAPNHICPGTCTDFQNLSVNATSYVWSFQGATPNVSFDQNPVNICYNTPGTYSVSLIVSNVTGSDTLTLNNYVTVYPYPAPQGISQSGDTLFANTGAVSYQWYHFGVAIPGATDYFYVAQGVGDYNVVATDIHNCEVEAAIFDVIASIQYSDDLSQMAVYPNPVLNKLSVRNLNSQSNEVSVCNLLGEKIMNIVAENSVNHDAIVYDVSALAPGIYYLEIRSAENTFRAKFVKSVGR